MTWIKRHEPHSLNRPARCLETSQQPLCRTSQALNKLEQRLGNYFGSPPRRQYKKSLASIFGAKANSQRIVFTAFCLLPPVLCQVPNDFLHPTVQKTSFPEGADSDRQVATTLVFSEFS